MPMVPTPPGLRIHAGISSTSPRLPPRPRPEDDVPKLAAVGRILSELFRRDENCPGLSAASEEFVIAFDRSRDWRGVEKPDTVLTLLFRRGGKYPIAFLSIRTISTGFGIASIVTHLTWVQGCSSSCLGSSEDFPLTGLK